MAHIPWEAKIVYPKSGCCKPSDFQPTLIRPKETKQDANFCSTHPSPAYMKQLEFDWTYAQYCQKNLVNKHQMSLMWWWKCLFPKLPCLKNPEGVMDSKHPKIVTNPMLPLCQKNPAMHTSAHPGNWRTCFFCYFLTILHRFLKTQGFLLVTRGFSEICAPKKGLDFQSIKEIWNQSICLFFWMIAAQKHTFCSIILSSYCVTIWWLAGSPLNQITIFCFSMGHVR